MTSANLVSNVSCTADGNLGEKEVTSHDAGLRTATPRREVPGEGPLQLTSPVTSWKPVTDLASAHYRQLSEKRIIRAAPSAGDVATAPSTSPMSQSSSCSAAQSSPSASEVTSCGNSDGASSTAIPPLTTSGHKHLRPRSLASTKGLLTRTESRPGSGVPPTVSLSRQPFSKQSAGPYNWTGTSSLNGEGAASRSLSAQIRLGKPKVAPPAESACQTVTRAAGFQGNASIRAGTPIRKTVMSEPKQDSALPKWMRTPAPCPFAPVAAATPSTQSASPALVQPRPTPLPTQPDSYKSASLMYASGFAKCARGHVMIALGKSRDDGWDCDARFEPGGCLSGITGFCQTSGMSRYRCERCVYDLCERCYSRCAAATHTPAPNGKRVARLTARSKSTEDRCAALIQRAASPAKKIATKAALSANPEPALGPQVAPLPKGMTEDQAAMKGVEAPLAVPAPHSETPRKKLALSAVPMNPVRPAQDVEEWSIDFVCRLGADDQQIQSLSERVPLLDMEKIYSVNQAVEGLNRGTISCPCDWCIMYSISNQGFFLLFKRGSKDAALAAIGVSDQSVGAGTVLRIGDCVCRITVPLGMGSFGAVWAAEALEGTSGEVAVKEILCRTPQELTNSALEAQLLATLTEGEPSECAKPNPAVGSRECSVTGGDGGSGGTGIGSQHSGKIPKLVASETESISQDVWRVRLVMSKVPGIPLDRFLQRWQKNIASLSITPRQLFDEGCRVARELIVQLAPTFERIAGVAYHRDVNSHNVLVETTDPLNPRFGLVDFGLAVDLKQWQGPVGPSSWHLVDIGGDCRYWPMSAWLQFECGWEELSKYPPLAEEYQSQLDFHALGITALQVLAAMSSIESTDCSPGAADGSHPDGFNMDLPDEVRILQQAWSQYWADATRFWERLLDVFRKGGDQNGLKVACITEGVHNTIGQDLANLRQALRDAAQACESAGTGFVHVQPLFGALLELVSAGGAVGLDEASWVASWAAVHAMAASNGATGAGTGSPAT